MELSKISDYFSFSKLLMCIIICIFSTLFLPFPIGPRCTHDVLLDMDTKCSGRRECNVEVQDSSFKTYVPCHKDLKSYLEASFTCIEGMNTSILF